MLATFEGTAFQVGYVLASVAGIIIGAVMLRSDIFSRVAAYALIVGDVIGLGLYVPVIGIFLSIISVPVLWIWYVLISRRLIQLGSGVLREEVKLHQS
jgi:ABC-type nitrate/sulfonate/bicarbonate transport system permease component